MEYLTNDELIFINHATVKRRGGHFVPPNNLLHPDSLDYLTESVDSEVFGEPLYPALHDRAAV